MRGRGLHGIPIVIRSGTALPRSVDVVFWSGRRYILGSSARPTRVGLVSAWAEAIVTTPRALFLPRPISLPDRKGNRTAAACARSWRSFVKKSRHLRGGLEPR
jgi:hypothetical protein